MHVSRNYTTLAPGLAETSSLVNSGTLPLLYAGAMLVDAVAALLFGMLYDKKGVRALVLSTLISAPFACFVFLCRTVPLLLVGIALWGVGMGAQESILKAAVTGMVPKQSRHDKHDGSLKWIPKRMKCPERSEPLGFGLLRAFFPFICAVFQASTFSTGIGHAKEKTLS